MASGIVHRVAGKLKPYFQDDKLVDYEDVEGVEEETARRVAGDLLISDGIASRQELDNALSAQLTRNEPLELVFTVEVTHNGVTYEEGDVVYVAPRRNSIQRRFNVRDSEPVTPTEQRVLRTDAASASTVGKLAITPTARAFTTREVQHLATPNSFTPAVYNAGGGDTHYQGVRESTPAPAGFDVGDWYVNRFTFHPRIVVQRGAAKGWEDTDWASVGGGLAFIGAFPTGSQAEVAPHASANGQVYLDVDDEILRQVTAFVAGSTAQPTEYDKKVLANEDDIARLEARIERAVVTGGGRAFGAGAGDIAPEAEGNSTAKWPATKLDLSGKQDTLTHTQLIDLLHFAVTPQIVQGYGTPQVTNADEVPLDWYITVNGASTLPDTWMAINLNSAATLAAPPPSTPGANLHRHKLSATNIYQFTLGIRTRSTIIEGRTSQRQGLDIQVDLLFYDADRGGNEVDRKTLTVDWVAKPSADGSGLTRDQVDARVANAKATNTDVDAVASTGTTLDGIQATARASHNDGKWLSVRKATRLLQRVLKKASRTTLGLVLIARAQDTAATETDTTRVPDVVGVKQLIARLASEHADKTIIRDDLANPIAASADNVNNILYRGNALYWNEHIHADVAHVTLRPFAVGDLPVGWTYGGAKQVGTPPNQHPANYVEYSIPAGHFNRRIGSAFPAFYQDWAPAGWRGKKGSELLAKSAITANGQVVAYGDNVYKVTAYSAATPDIYRWVPLLKDVDEAIAALETLVAAKQDSLTDAEIGVKAFKNPPALSTGEQSAVRTAIGIARVLRPRGTFRERTAYAVFDVVFYNRHYYIVNQAVPASNTAVPVDGDTWVLLSVDPTPEATETRQGTVELATRPELNAGTAGRVPDAALVKAYVDDSNRSPVRSSVLVAAVNGSDTAGVTRFTLPVGYNTYNRLMLVFWRVSNNRIGAITLPTAFLHAQTASREIYIDFILATWNPTTRVFSGDTDRIIYAELRD